MMHWPGGRDVMEAAFRAQRDPVDVRAVVFRYVGPGSAPRSVEYGPGGRGSITTGSGMRLAVERGEHDFLHLPELLFPDLRRITENWCVIDRSDRTVTVRTCDLANVEALRSLGSRRSPDITIVLDRQLGVVLRYEARRGAEVVWQVDVDIEESVVDEP